MLFLVRYGICVFYGMAQVIVGAVFDGETLIGRYGQIERRISLGEVRLTVLCVGTTFSALVLISERDYLVLNRCNSFGGLKRGGESGRQFHELVHLLQKKCERNEVILCQRKRRQWVSVPRWVFEWECWGERVEKTVQAIRERTFSTDEAGKSSGNL